MKLIKTEYSQADSSRCTLVFEEDVKYKTFTTIVVSEGLYSGMELSEEEFLRIKEASQRASARSRAAKIAGASPVSKKQLIKKLTEKGEREEEAKSAADWLEEIGAVDDSQYAAMLVRHYSSRGYGPSKIKFELSKKGIDRVLWEDALGNRSEPGAVLEKFITAKLSPGETDRKKIKKVSDALGRRGFSWDEISSAMRRVLDEEFPEEKY